MQYQLNQKLADLVAIDTHDLGHGIAGGLEKKGQEYMKTLFADMGARGCCRPAVEPIPGSSVPEGE